MTRSAIVASFFVAGMFGLASVATSMTTPSTVSSLPAGQRKAHSAALFMEMGRVIQSPRCLNCHPADRRPTQDDDMHVHNPPMVADAAGHGAAGFTCSQCHSHANFNTGLPHLQSIPGNPKWALAPAVFAWQHRTLAQICRQIKDPARNGNRTVAQIHDHVAHDTLVGWSWKPGLGRKPSPGTQAAFGELTQRWIDTGSECPDS
jgi:hypothetical protein